MALSILYPPKGTSTSPTIEFVASKPLRSAAINMKYISLFAPSYQCCGHPQVSLAMTRHLDTSRIKELLVEGIHPKAHPQCSRHNLPLLYRRLILTIDCGNRRPCKVGSARRGGKERGIKSGERYGETEGEEDVDVGFKAAPSCIIPASHR